MNVSAYPGCTAIAVFLDILYRLQWLSTANLFSRSLSLQGTAVSTASLDIAELGILVETVSGRPQLRRVHSCGTKLK